MFNLEKPGWVSPESIEKPRSRHISSSEALVMGSKDSFWDEKIINHPEVQRQAEVRRNTIESLNSVFNTLPKATTEIPNAVLNNEINEDKVISMYEDMSKFLNDDPLNARIALYLPFEIFPNSHIKIESTQLQESIESFKITYIEKWKSLLNEKDIRVHFADGDIPEIELRSSPLTQVVKAAHLIPILVQKGMVSVPEVLEIMSESKDEVLRDSIADTIPVLADLNLITDNDIEIMKKSPDRLIKNMSAIVQSNIGAKRYVTEEITYRPFNEIISGIEESLSNTEIGKDTLPESRRNWEIKRDKEQVVSDYSNEIAQSIISGDAKFEDLISLFSSENENHVIIGIESSKRLVESISELDIEKAKNISEKINEYLAPLFTSGSSTIQDAIESTWLRWQSANINIPPIQIEASDEETNISEDSSSIELNPALSDSVYPASIIFGSKAKGYGTRNADTDIAVFIKPNTLLEKRPEIQSALSEQFKNEHIGDNILEFWIENSDDTDHIKDFPHLDKRMGDSTLSAVLFGGHWCGNENTIKDLHSNVLTEFLYSKGKKLHSTDARTLWLRELERDTLQYRLMHKGYARSHSPQGGINTLHSDAIDSNSMFFDSGYRRMATELFLKIVFLPQIEK